MKNAEYIDELIGKYLAGEAGPEEAMELEEWKSQSQQNMAYFKQSERLFESISGTKFPQADVSQAWNKLKAESLGEKTKVVPMRSGFYWRVAAAVVVLLAMTAVLIYVLPAAQEQNLAYEAGADAKTFALSDNSSIQMDPHSRLELSKGFGTTNRTVILKGSGNFTVKHDDQLPFIVDAGKVYIKDIGTVFHVRNVAGNDTLTVKVLEGTVLLYDSLGSQVMLSAPAEAIYLRSSRQIIHYLKEESPVPLHFDFENTNLGDAVAQLNASYKTTITLENPALAKCAITTSFTGQDIETILSVITETLGLQYERTQAGYLIKGEACNH